MPGVDKHMIGAIIIEGAVPLPFPMPSLDKIKPGEDQLARFLQNPGGFVLSEKLDGLSALWIPDMNKLYLRGDGIKGLDISHLIKLGIQGLTKAACNQLKAVRGELILLRSQGVALARSWVNGQIHQNTPLVKEVSKIHFVAYELMATDLSRSKQFQYLVANGFEVPWFSTVERITEAELSTALQVRRQNSIYDTDGIVIGLNLVPKSESIATKAKNPKDCVAFKMPLADQSAETVVRAVIWTPSAQGYIIPRIQFDPVKIGATTIEFCTGHNARMILANKLGPGAKIIIRRSGDVIPKLDKVLVSAMEASFPPANTWKWNGDEATAAHIKSIHIGDEIIIARLHHFFKVLEIPGAGYATAASLVDAGMKMPSMIWVATSEQLSKILGPKTGASLYANLRTVLGKVSEKTLMQASSMMPRGVGDTKLDNLFKVEVDARKWPAITQEIAGWTRESYIGFMNELPNYVEWRMRELSWIPYPIVSIPIKETVNKLVCMTGFRDSNLEAVAAKKGYTLVPVLTAKVVLLLIPDGPVKETEKVKAAREKKIPILSRSQFVAQYLA